MAISVMTWVWDHSRSRHGARLVLLAIADCASSDGGNAWPSNAELQRKAGLGERAVRMALAELVSLGELEVQYNQGRRGSNRYRVIMDGSGGTCTPAKNAPRQNLPGPRDDGKSQQAEAPNPAENAPSAKSAGGQKMPEPPAENAPGTVQEPKPQKKTSSSSDARATRIPDDFTVTPEMAGWARNEVPALIAAGRGKTETDKFVDHWHSAAGANARKRDWTAAWRNWMRKAEDDLGRGVRHPAAAMRSTAQSGSDRARDQAEALKAKLAGKALTVTIEETIDLLALAAAFDRRNIGETDTIAWHAALGELDFADTQAAVIAHYRESREWIMPADVWTRVRAMRRDRIAREVAPAPDHELTDSPGRYRAALAGMVKRIGDGFATRLAIAGPVREGPPPAEFTAALAALPKPLTKQERAALQAAQSRAEREAADRLEDGAS